MYEQKLNEKFNQNKLLLGINRCIISSANLGKKKVINKNK